MNAKLRDQWTRRSRRSQHRLLDKNRTGIPSRVLEVDPCERPCFAASNIHYEFALRDRGIAHGGIGAIHLLARRSGLIDAIDERLHLLKFHLPYHESDHVLNFAYNALCDGTCLQDLELRRSGRSLPFDALGTHAHS